jgi:hypothetical protein
MGWRRYWVRLDRGRLVRRRSRRQRGQEPERIDVAVRLVGLADAQVDVRLGCLSNRPHDVSLAHRERPRDRGGTEALQRDGVTVGGADRDRLPTRRDDAGKADRSGCRRAHRRPGRSADVDAAVLAAGIGIVTKDEGSKHRPVDGPGPGERGLHADLERDEDRKQQGEAFHRHSSSLSNLRTSTSVARRPPRCQLGRQLSSSSYSDPL